MTLTGTHAVSVLHVVTAIILILLNVENYLLHHLNSLSVAPRPPNLHIFIYAHCSISM